MKGKREKIYIVMPAYNEEANVAVVARQWLSVAAELEAEGHEASVIIADDGSTDATARILAALAAEDKRLTAASKPNTGHGSTLLYLYRRAVAEGATYVFQTDSDGQTDPREFRAMWDARAEYDIQVGLRSKRGDGAARAAVAKVLRAVIRLTTDVSVADANTPFRLMEARALKHLLEIIPEDFFLANAAASALAVKAGMRTRWVEISFKPRQAGVNSINIRKIFRIGLSAVKAFRRIGRAAHTKSWESSQDC